MVLHLPPWSAVVLLETIGQVSEHHWHKMGVYIDKVQIAPARTNTDEDNARRGFLLWGFPILLFRYHYAPPITLGGSLAMISYLFATYKLRSTDSCCWASRGRCGQCARSGPSARLPLRPRGCWKG